MERVDPSRFERVKEPLTRVVNCFPHPLPAPHTSLPTGGQESNSRIKFRTVFGIVFFYYFLSVIDCDQLQKLICRTND